MIQRQNPTVPIYQTSSYVFDNTQQAKNLFGLKEGGNIYTRIMNPTSDVLSRESQPLREVLVHPQLASGAAAITDYILNIAQAGDEIVAATLYGGTYNLFSTTLPRLGIKTIFVDQMSGKFCKEPLQKIQNLYIESIGNQN